MATTSTRPTSSPSSPSASAKAPRSPAQAAASRANGTKSHGPVSAGGRARSAQNALRHGLRAQTPALLPDEDEGSFLVLWARLVREHDPRDAVEAGLVEQLALLLWRLRRAEALEVEVLTAREPRVTVHHPNGHPESPRLWDPARLNTVLRYRAQAERALYRTLAVLHERRAQRAVDVTPGLVRDGRAVDGLEPDGDDAPWRTDPGGRAAAGDGPNEAGKRLDAAGRGFYPDP